MDARQRYCIGLNGELPTSPVMTLQQATAYGAAIIDAETRPGGQRIALESCSDGTAVGWEVAWRNADDSLRYDPDLQNEGDGAYWLAGVRRALAAKQVRLGAPAGQR